MRNAGILRRYGKWAAVKPLAVVMFLCTCAQNNKYTAHFFSLDTVMDITLYSDSQTAKADLDSLQVFFGSMDSLLSLSRPESEVSRINGRRDSSVVLSPALKTIIAVCRREYGFSGGLFDVTVEPLKYLYGLESHQTQNRVPGRGELDSALRLVGFNRIVFPSDSTMVLPAGMHLDLGGIAKGYILAAAADFLKGRGYRNFLINAGGDIVMSGRKPDGRPWMIGVAHPRRKNAMIATLRVPEGCVFTSGDYERFFTDNGKRYHHLFDPRTGMPGTCNMSATVVGSDALAVDAVVKTAFFLPAEQALRYLKTRGMPGFIIDSSGIGWASAELEGVLHADSSLVVNYR
jgi:thiamine biosynthesis lipoprotein